MAKKVTGDSYTNENIQNLQEQIDKANESLQQFNTQAATDESLRDQATNEYTPIYNAQVQEQEALKNSATSTLNNQLSAIDRQYAKDQETLGRTYDKQRTTANNTMLARGFNNSSLAAAMLNHVETERGRALQNLAEGRTASEASARDAYNNAITSADAALARLAADLQMNIDSRYQALKSADYDRVFKAQQAQNAVTQYINELMLQIEQLRQQGYSLYLQGEKSSGASSGGDTDNGSDTNPPPNDPGPSLDEQFNDSNNGSNAIVSSARAGVNAVKNAVTGAKSAAQSATNALADALKKAAAIAQSNPQQTTSNNVVSGALADLLNKKK